MAFPTTGILDDCQRANESPLSNGGKWGAISGTQLDLSSNLITSNGGLRKSAWTFEAFDPDCEAWVTTGGPPLFESGVVFARLLNLGASYDGYGVVVTNDGSVTTFDLDIRRWDNGSDTVIAGPVNVNQANFLGWGIACDGDQIAAWVNHGLGVGWTNPLTDTDATYNSTGYVGAQIFQTGASPTLGFSSFGGGAVAPIFMVSFDSKKVR